MNQKKNNFPNLQNIKLKPAPIRIIIFLLALIIIWLPFALPTYLFLKNDPNLTTIITMGLLFISFVTLLKLWGKYIDREPRIFHKYGLTFKKKNIRELILGFAIGSSTCFLLFILEAIFGWVKINPLTASLFKIIIEGLVSAFGIALAEELLFRGWLLEELQKDYSKKLSLYLNGLIFACAHFIKPLTEIVRTFITFPALLLLGFTLVLAKRKKRNRLGICIGLHSGLVWSYYILSVGQLIKYSDRVPSWITGIDGNPLAGILGLLFLIFLIGFFK